MVMKYLHFNPYIPHVLLWREEDDGKVVAGHTTVRLPTPREEDKNNAEDHCPTLTGQTAVQPNRVPPDRPTTVRVMVAAQHFDYGVIHGGGRTKIFGKDPDVLNEIKRDYRRYIGE